MDGGSLSYLRLLIDLIVIEHIIEIQQICFSFKIFELAVETIVRLNFKLKLTVIKLSFSEYG